MPYITLSIARFNPLHPYRGVTSEHLYGLKVSANPRVKIVDMWLSTIEPTKDLEHLTSIASPMLET